MLVDRVDDVTHDVISHYSKATDRVRRSVFTCVANDAWGTDDVAILL